MQPAKETSMNEIETTVTTVGMNAEQFTSSCMMLVGMLLLAVIVSVVIVAKLARN